MSSGGSGTGEWLEKALSKLCGRVESGLCLDAEVISGLVSYCELAPPEDAQEYLNNIAGPAGQSVIEEYLRRRGYRNSSNHAANASSSKLQAYVKPPTEEGFTSGTKKQTRVPREATSSSNSEKKPPTSSTASTSNPKGNLGNSKKKKSGKVVSLAEAAKGTVVFQQGKPCSCQARRHRLVSNCLSCGKIVCEQEGEGPCSFCGALVLKEGSSYAGLDEAVVPLSDAEATAEAFAKRLVDYDRNSAARTTVIDDQSDYYEIEGNKWLSTEEKELLIKKREQVEEDERVRRNKVVVTFDLVGRKVVVNKDEASEEHGLLRPLDEKETNRIKPNPSVKVQPVFVAPADSKASTKGRSQSKKFSTSTSTGLCLEITGRVQHGSNDIGLSISAGTA
ncbi:hypothetical protein Syun_013233 [Stephania yunnanensis]|uniref:Zinc finger C2HC5-type domain-containing protein n=1 Tax=Stephania yunnanensis TaxID=152371 RepID=A0AAP0K0Y6_9MAGN